jgi:hypothetical protein
MTGSASVGTLHAPDVGYVKDNRPELLERVGLL